MNQYGNPQYWEERYQKETEPFDWFQRFKGLRNLIQQYITQESLILNVGAGSSKLSEEMYDEGYQNITNIDISQTLIKNMQERYNDREESFKYICMDIKKMEFEQNSFDFIIDKGALDCILCGESSTANSHKAVSEIYRVLRNQGVYFLVSYGSPENRKNILQKPEFQWTVTEHQIPKPAKAVTDDSQEKVHYVYICQKNIMEQEDLQQNN